MCEGFKCNHNQSLVKPDKISNTSWWLLPQNCSGCEENSVPPKTPLLVGVSQEQVWACKPLDPNSHDRVTINALKQLGQVNEANKLKKEIRNSRH
jgi:hypothetical protein